MADTLANDALLLYNDRRRRADFFPKDLFSDHGWDMLLWLFVETERGRRVVVADAARSAGLSMETTRRWVGALRQMRLVDAPPVDLKADGALTLTDDGHRTMLEFLIGRHA